MRDYQLRRAKELERSINNLYKLKGFFDGLNSIFKKRLGFHSSYDEVYLYELGNDLGKEIKTAIRNVVDKKISELENEFKNL